MFLYCLKQTAKSIATDEGNSHRKRIEEDEAFYKNWLFPRFERFYRQQGWPPLGGDGLSSDGSAADADATGRGDAHPAGGGHCCPSSGKRKTASRLSCARLGRKTGSRFKHALKRLKPAARRRGKDASPADELHPQVGVFGGSV